jgi:valyl-tRNA synthetase
VYLSGLIRDEHGRKMSKTYGNVIDPLTVMDELGTDALRFTLLVGSSPGNDQNLSVKKVEANRNFANKMWNAGRFVVRAIGTIAPNQGMAEPGLADKNILERLGNLVRDTERLFQAFQYGEAGRQIYDFFWSDFADWHIEAAKQQISRGGDVAARAVSTLIQVLDTCLRLLHPFTPFVTEEIWGHLRLALLDSPLRGIAEGWPDALIVAPWPDPATFPASSEAAKLFRVVVEESVQTVRNYRAEYNINPNEKLGSPVIASGIYYADLVEQAPLIGALAGTAVPEIFMQLDRKPDNSTAFVTDTGIVVHIPTGDTGRKNAAEERARLSRELADSEAQIKRVEQLLASNFGSKAPAAVVNKERERLAALKETAERLRAQLK